MRVAIVGATGLVGSTMLRILEERNFPITELIPVASERSVGTKINYKGKEHTVVSVDEAISRKPQLALFSAGGSISLELAPRFEAIGCYVVDNSSAWRMHPDKKLVVPEVNGHVLKQNDYIIANPNCSTIQMVMVLQPLHKNYGIKRVVVSTYQSVTGTGQKAVKELLDERAGGKGDGVYPHPIDMNVLPHIDVFQDNGYTKEEMKMVLETCKIMGDDNIKVTATTVRVPVMGGHSESVNVEMNKDFDETTVKQQFSEMPGVTVIDNPSNNEYPMPLFAAGKDDVFVGRIRRDYSQPNTLNCWIVADNLRKGAATNAVQIAEYLHLQGWI
ncbi:aspartate-semialdehyde dehydrogenase [Taibaiella soli]|uniref:Aspartate-semialdehyde dehydrogenase n=1 Tax=Taibaiella soli TaxID=1649169 RepID=A0A2W2BFK4_9BACT|nr:aspartate-semialdehyde dehydrogenase [Taibaiella soli]PZF72226.1 aspartate-semialdehyde dehydrogenase [Taibaiella soli]